VLQALYFCKPFREHVLNYRLTQKVKKDHLLTCLADLFHTIINGKRRTGALQPKKFINKLRKENSAFDNDMQQDAHEFLNHLLNTCGDILLEEKQKLKSNHQLLSDETWIHELFQGTLVSTTKCLNCETVR